MAEFPRCASSLRDGTPCGHTIAPGAEFCPRHVALVEQYGAEALKQGTYPSRKAPRTLRAVREPIVAETVEARADSGNGRADPASVRPALAQAAADELGTITAVLMDAATNTTRAVWATPAWPECGMQFRQEVVAPDHRARVAAVEVLLREGLGRPAQAEEASTPTFPDDPALIESMSWEDMQAGFAAIYVDEIAAVQRQGGKALVREKLAALSDDKRYILREALLEPELA